MDCCRKCWIQRIPLDSSFHPCSARFLHLCALFSSRQKTRSHIKGADGLQALTTNLHKMLRDTTGRICPKHSVYFFHNTHKMSNLTKPWSHEAMKQQQQQQLWKKSKTTTKETWLNDDTPRKFPAQKFPMGKNANFGKKMRRTGT